MKPWFLVAQVNPADFGRAFREAEQNPPWSSALLVMALAVAVVLGLWLTMRLTGEGRVRRYRSPRKLFYELCLAHQLDKPSRKLLQRLAAAHSIAPSLLFLDPERFDASHLSAAWASSRPQLEALRDVIFGRRIDEEAASKAN